jgi:hypothetical protein
MPHINDLNTNNRELDERNEQKRLPDALDAFPFRSFSSLLFVAYVADARQTERVLLRD